MIEIRREWVTINGITHGRHEPNANVPTGPRPIKIDGYWSGIGNVTEPEQIADAGFGVHPGAIEARWGEEGLARYEAVLAETGQTSITVADQDRLASVRSQLSEIMVEH